MNLTASAVGAYLDELPPERRAALTRLREIIREELPEAEERVNDGLIAFERGGVVVCALGSRKGFMALYVCAANVVEKHRALFKGLNCGKGCIRFTKLADLPLNAVRFVLGELR